MEFDYCSLITATPSISALPPILSFNKLRPLNARTCFYLFRSTPTFAWLGGCTNTCLITRTQFKINLLTPLLYSLARFLGLLLASVEPQRCVVNNELCSVETCCILCLNGYTATVAGCPKIVIYQNRKPLKKIR
jgi:hypothetical protein